MNLISLLSIKLAIDSRDIISLLENASKKYKVYRIPKRTHGFRIIAQPTADLKKIQRAFVSECSLPSHKCATAYHKGASIRQNAQLHVNSKFLLKLDLENFFLKITPEIFWREYYLLPQKPFEFSDSDRETVNQLLFWCPSKKKYGKLVLSIGAPSSPYIANFCMNSFDECISEYCRKHAINYSRYADDMTFSGDNREQLFYLKSFVEKLLDSKFSGSLRINTVKTVLISKAKNRHVTGLTLTNDNQLSIGRKKKRLVKHYIHQFLLNQLSEDKKQKLRGWLAFIKDVEPMFLVSLEGKYSRAVIEQIKKEALHAGQ